MLKQPDAQRQAELAALQKQGARVEHCVHMRYGLVEVLEKRADRWAFRVPPGEFVEDREPTEFRPIMSAAEARALLALLVDVEALRATDAERREKLKKIDPSKADLRKPKSAVKPMLYFAGLKAAGLELWSMEKTPCARIRDALLDELALVLGEPAQVIAAKLPP